MKPDLQRSGSWIGLGGLAVAAFLYGYSAFVVRDLVSTVVLPLFWLVLLGLGCRWFMAHPYRSLALPLVAVAAWFAAMLS